MALWFDAMKYREFREEIDHTASWDQVLLIIRKIIHGALRVLSFLPVSYIRLEYLILKLKWKYGLPRPNGELVRKKVAGGNELFYKSSIVIISSSTLLFWNDVPGVIRPCSLNLLSLRTCRCALLKKSFRTIAIAYGTQVVSNSPILLLWTRLWSVSEAYCQMRWGETQSIVITMNWCIRGKLISHQQYGLYHQPDRWGYLAKKNAIAVASVPSYVSR